TPISARKLLMLTKRSTAAGCVSESRASKPVSPTHSLASCKAWIIEDASLSFGSVEIAHFTIKQDGDAETDCIKSRKWVTSDESFVSLYATVQPTVRSRSGNNFGLLPRPVTSSVTA